MNPGVTTQRKLTLLPLLYGVFALLVVFAFVWWWQRPPAKARHIIPLLNELDRVKATTGQHPNSYQRFSSYTNLAGQFTFYPGVSDTNGVTWDPREVSNHDFTVLLDSTGYEVFMPVGRMKMISFSSFPVWRYDSNERHWRKGRIHWSFAGTYWSKD